jgi:hypothetical protein
MAGDNDTNEAKVQVAGKSLAMRVLSTELYEGAEVARNRFHGSAKCYLCGRTL